MKARPARDRAFCVWHSTSLIKGHESQRPRPDSKRLRIICWNQIAPSAASSRRSFAGRSPTGSDRRKDAVPGRAAASARHFDSRIRKRMAFVCANGPSPRASPHCSQAAVVVTEPGRRAFVRHTGAHHPADGDAPTPIPCGTGRDRIGAVSCPRWPVDHAWVNGCLTVTLEIVKPGRGALRDWGRAGAQT